MNVHVCKTTMVIMEGVDHCICKWKVDCTDSASLPQVKNSAKVGGDYCESNTPRSSPCKMPRGRAGEKRRRGLSKHAQRAPCATAPEARRMTTALRVWQGSLGMATLRSCAPGLPSSVDARAQARASTFQTSTDPLTLSAEGGHQCDRACLNPVRPPECAWIHDSCIKRRTSPPSMP